MIVFIFVLTIFEKNFKDMVNGLEFIPELQSITTGLMSISWTQKVKLFYAVLLANNSHCSGVM